jgi:uncharacterized membrane protein
MNIEEIVKGLKEQGLDDEAAMSALKEMLEKQEISEEDFQKAVELLKGAAEDEEKELAKKLYGDDLFE